MASYMSLRKKNLQEKNEKLKELGLTGQESNSRRRGRRQSVPDDDEVALPPKKVSKQAKKRRGQKKAPSLSDANSDPDDPDYCDDDDIPDVKPEFQRPRRSKARQNYAESDEVNSFYCEDCETYFNGECPTHTLTVVNDVPVAVNANKKLRAKMTAPAPVRIGPSEIVESGEGAWAKEKIEIYTRFGPYKGEIVSFHDASSYAWEVKKNGKILHCVDADDPAISNWMRYVRCARQYGEQNLVSYQYGQDIYFKTIKDIEPNEELCVWYGHKFGCESKNDPIEDDEGGDDDGGDEPFKCHACSNSYKSSYFLRAHMKICRILASRGLSGGESASANVEQRSESKEKRSARKRSTYSDDANTRSGKATGSDKSRTASTKEGVNSSTYRCPGCEVSYTSLHFLENHKRSCAILNRIPDSETIYVCDGCENAFSTEKYFNTHQKCCRELSLNNDSVALFTCFRCNIAFVDEVFFKRHVQYCSKFDGPQYLVTCPGCNAAFNSTDYLERHKKNCSSLDHKKVDGIPFQCKGCQMAYSTQKFLDRHLNICRFLKSNSTDAPPSMHECTVCHSVYATQHFLEVHMQSCELPDRETRSIKCDGCGDLLGNLEFLKRHQLKCPNLKPSVLKCLFCDRTFSNKSSQTRHKKVCQNQHSARLRRLEKEKDKARIEEVEKSTSPEDLAVPTTSRQNTKLGKAIKRKGEVGRRGSKRIKRNVTKDENNSAEESLEDEINSQEVKPAPESGEDNPKVGQSEKKSRIKQKSKTKIQEDNLATVVENKTTEIQEKSQENNNSGNVDSESGDLEDLQQKNDQRGPERPVTDLEMLQNNDRGPLDNEKVQERNFENLQKNQDPLPDSCPGSGKQVINDLLDNQENDQQNFQEESQDEHFSKVQTNLEDPLKEDHAESTRTGSRNDDLVEVQRNHEDNEFNIEIKHHKDLKDVENLEENEIQELDPIAGSVPVSRISEPRNEDENSDLGSRKEDPEPNLGSRKEDQKADLESRKEYQEPIPESRKEDSEPVLGSRKGDPESVPEFTKEDRKPDFESRKKIQD